MLRLVASVALGCLLTIVGVTAVTAAPLSPGDVLVADQGGFVYHYSATGADLGTFASGLRSPSWITVDPGGNVYVTEYGLGEPGTIIKFRPDGARLLAISTAFTAAGVAIAPDGTIYVAHYGREQTDRYSASGLPLGQFTPFGSDFIAFNADGDLFTPAGGPIYRIAPNGTAEVFGALAGAEGIAFDATGNAYVSSTLNIIEKFSPSGADLGVFASTGLNEPYGLAFDGDGNLYVANYAGGHVHKFSPSGDDLGVFASSGLALPRDVAVVPGPQSKDDCEHGGWKSFEFPRTFKNQGDCLSFVNTRR